MVTPKPCPAPPAGVAHPSQDRFLIAYPAVWSMLQGSVLIAGSSSFANLPPSALAPPCIGTPTRHTMLARCRTHLHPLPRTEPDPALHQSTQPCSCELKLFASQTLVSQLPFRPLALRPCCLTCTDEVSSGASGQGSQTMQAPQQRRGQNVCCHHVKGSRA